MPGKTRLLGSAALALLLATGAHAQDGDATEGQDQSGGTEQSSGSAATQDPSTVVATVNGTDITLGELVIARTKLPQQYQQLAPGQLFQGLVDQLVRQQVLADQLDGTPERLKMALANEERSLRAGETISRITDEAVTDEAVQEAYDAQYASAEPTKEYNASHILVESEEEAQDLVEQAREEGADFAQLAQENSTGPSGPQGGELGWFSEGMMVEPFQDAVEGMEAGEVAGPVKTQFGWHVIKLNETRQKEAPALEEVRGEIENQIRQDAIQSRLDQLMETAEISRPEEGQFDPTVLNDLSILEQ